MGQGGGVVQAHSATGYRQVTLTKADGLKTSIFLMYALI